MIRRRKVLAFGAGVAAVGLLAGCAGGARTGDSGTQDDDTVTFRSWAPIDPALGDMIAAFEDANPGKTIDATVMGGPDYWVDIAARVSSNTM